MPPPKVKQVALFGRILNEKQGASNVITFLYVKHTVLSLMFLNILHSHCEPVTEMCGKNSIFLISTPFEFQNDRKNVHFKFQTICLLNYVIYNFPAIVYIYIYIYKSDSDNLVIKMVC